MMFRGKKRKLDKPSQKLKDDYYTVWWPNIRGLLIQSNFETTLSYLRGLMNNPHELRLFQGEKVYPSYEKAMEPLGECTRTPALAYYSICLMLPISQISKEEDSLFLTALPQPFQLLYAIIPPRATFNNFLDSSAELTVYNTVYNQLHTPYNQLEEKKAHPQKRLAPPLLLDLFPASEHVESRTGYFAKLKETSDRQHFTDLLLYRFFSNDVDEIVKLPIRCILGAMKINDVIEAYEELLKKDDAMIRAEKTLQGKLPWEILGLIREYTVGTPRLSNR